LITEYKTIAAPSQGEFKDKGSKFLAFAFQVDTEEQVKEWLAHLRKEHPKSRHVCYAFSIGANEPLERSNDDGEPSGTAGKPILGQIHSIGLSNTLIAVVRYFGGTLLGVPGLIAAYKGAAHYALTNAKVVTHYIQAEYKLETDYQHFHELMNYLKREGVVVVDQQLDARYLLTIRIGADRQQKFYADITEASHIIATFIRYV
jgi:uncharacterized YigZ family protein